MRSDIIQRQEKSYYLRIMKMKMGYQHNTEAFFYTLLIAVPIVIAYYRNKSLCESGQWYTGKLHRTLQNCQCTDVDVSELFQAAIKYKPDQALRARHNERRNSQSQYGKDYSSVQFHIRFLQRQRGAFGKKESQYPGRTASL